MRFFGRNNRPIGARPASPEGRSRGDLICRGVHHSLGTDGMTVTRDFKVIAGISAADAMRRATEATRVNPPRGFIPSGNVNCEGDGSRRWGMDYRVRVECIPCVHSDNPDNARYCRHCGDRLTTLHSVGPVTMTWETR